MTNHQKTAAGRQEAGGSALRVAMARAVHQLLDEPLVFADPYALPILGPELEHRLREDPFTLNDPMARSMRAAIVARTLCAEDELRMATEAGVRQCVILGAGLDTLALRAPHAAMGLRMFEVDHPRAQQFKRELMAQAGIALHGSAVMVPVDLRQGSLAHALERAGLRRDQPAFFSWLGVTPYLDDEAIWAVLDFIARLPPGSAVTFDYRVAPQRLNAIERVMEEHVAAMFAAMGEPWLSAFEPEALRARLHEMGYAHAVSLGSADLNGRYFARRKDGLQTAGGGLEVMCARV
ncbi:SAM-dependent methyltransferase [Pigmentiphaga sp. NML080357]|uniref:class I SAM-dependent methyltransferase n=1 Tax=Pigmentiphaga sp. NML080357 TaxID=2008675 RepID=UPI000B407663|nr:class I SAM-dependent methyltransferase [Pigmentiphaga sp. NML080357]OVZ55411.1 SAM-dependent methyltransferase [Pigmentiphaga sp. NML080357]